MPLRRRSSWPSGSPATRPAISTASSSPPVAVRPSRPRKAGQELLQTDRQTRQAQGRLPRHRLSRHPAGRAGDHRSARLQGALRAADAGRIPGAQHQLLPGARAVRHGHQSVRSVRRRPDRRGHRVRGSRHRRRGFPGAGTERRRASRRRPGTSNESARSATSTTSCWCPTR